MLTATGNDYPDRNNALRIHVVDDEPQVLVAIANMIEHAGHHVVMHRTAEDLLQQFRVGESCCVVLDLSLHDIDGRTLLSNLLELDPTLPVVMVSGKADIRAALECVNLGAVSFLEKPVERHLLSAAIAEGLQRSAAKRIRLARTQEIRELIRSLTPREREVMAHLRKGQTVKQIAFDLGVSHKTIQVHRSRILDRMHVKSLVDLANLLHELDPETLRRLTESESESPPPPPSPNRPLAKRPDEDQDEDEDGLAVGVGI